MKVYGFTDAGAGVMEIEKEFETLNLFIGGGGGCWNYRRTYSCSQ